MMRWKAAAAFLATLLCAASSARAGIRFGFFSAGLNDGITDVAGVRVAHLTKIEGTTVRTGATVVLSGSDPWNQKVSAATEALNGNGEMTGTAWINEAGYLETPIVLTDTLDVGRADDGVISYMMQRYPQIGLKDDVPLPVVAECDDGALNDIRGRHVSASEIADLIGRAVPGQFARGSVGAGTGMIAFGFKAGIGSASRVLPKEAGGFSVGVLVNDNTGSAPRRLLRIDGVHVGEKLKDRYLPLHAMAPSATRSGRQSDGSIIVVIATDAPLDSRQLHAIARRAELGMGRVGLTSQASSGDLLLAFSTTYVYRRDADFNVLAPRAPILQNDRAINALYQATAEATEAAIYDALFSSKTIAGRDGLTVFGLPVEEVRTMLAPPAR